MGNVVPQVDKKTEETLARLQMNKSHLKSMYAKFKKYDKDSSGDIGKRLRERESDRAQQS